MSQTVTATDVVLPPNGEPAGQVSPAEINVVYSDGTDAIRDIDPYMREVAYQVQQ